MNPIFREARITCFALLLHELRPVRFPDKDAVEAVTVIRLKADVRHNAEALIELCYFQLRFSAMLNSDVKIILNQLLRDAHLVKSECGKVSVNFIRPKHRRILSRLSTAYEEMRLAAIIACQQSEPTLIDSLTVSL